MTRPSAINWILAGLCAGLPLAGQGPSLNLVTGRCDRDLPLDAGQGFDHQRYLVLGDRTLLFDRTWTTPGARWRQLARSVPSPGGAALGLTRQRTKWRDGALWRKDGRHILRRDPDTGAWVLKARPALEFMDFEVDMTGRILLVSTADPATRTYRALLEAVAPNGRDTAVLAPYPDPGCQAWGKAVPLVAAVTLQVGYEAVQILEFTVLYNPLARRLFIFRPLEDRIKEVDLGLPVRCYPDLKGRPALDDLCWQVLPKDDTEAWVVMDHTGPGLTAIPLDLFEGTAGEARPLPGLSLPVFPDPEGRLTGLTEALRAFTTPAGTPPPPPSHD